MKEYMGFLEQRQSYYFCSNTCIISPCLKFFTSRQWREGRCHSSCETRVSCTTGTQKVWIWNHIWNLDTCLLPTEESDRNFCCLISYIPLKDKCMVLVSLPFEIKTHISEEIKVSPKICYYIMFACFLVILSPPRLACTPDCYLFLFRPSWLWINLQMFILLPIKRWWCETEIIVRAW